MADLQTVALGMDLGGSSIKWGIVLQDGSIVHDDTVELTSRSVEHVVGTLSSIVSAVLERDDVVVVGIGIGSPGLVDATRSIVRVSPNFPEWENVQLVELVRESVQTDLPIVLENDANVLVYSESRWGAAVGLKHFVVLTLGTGVGGGVMVDGHLLRGFNGGAGELGHIPIDINGPVCGTGVTGSFEAFCSISGVMREAEQVYAPDSPPETPDLIAKAADEGDERARKVWKHVGHYLGAGVAAYINIFNPEAVLIGGGIAGADEHLMAPARETAQARCFAPNWNDCNFTRAKLENKAGMLGAASMAFDAAGVATKIRT